MGDEVTRYRFPKQRDFVRFVLRREWGGIHRVQIGDATSQELRTNLVNWCRAKCEDRWSRSDAFEVFYFENLSDATHFRLRWCGRENNDNS